MRMPARLSCAKGEPWTKKQERKAYVVSLTDVFTVSQYACAEGKGEVKKITLENENMTLLAWPLHHIKVF